MQFLPNFLFSIHYFKHLLYNSLCLLEMCHTNKPTLPLNVLCVFMLCDIRDEDEVESFLTEIRHPNAPWALSGMNSADALLETRLR